MASTVAVVVDDLSASERYAVAVRAIAAQASSIVEAGVDVVVVGARLASDTTTWGALDALEPTVIVLLPSVDAAVARNGTDPSRLGAFAVPESWVRESYGLDWPAWRDVTGAVVLDTTSMSQDDVVAELVALLG